MAREAGCLHHAQETMVVGGMETVQMGPAMAAEKVGGAGAMVWEATVAHWMMAQWTVRYWV